jgi:hypothetical protein
VSLVELFNTGTILLGKLAVDGGMFVFSLLCYRSILGAIFILPFALFFERLEHFPIQFLNKTHYLKNKLSAIKNFFETVIRWERFPT